MSDTDETKRVDVREARRARSAASEPHAIGWVLREDPQRNGYLRTKVRIPLSHLARYADASTSYPPDGRAQHVAWISREAMHDDFLQEMASEARKEKTP